MHIGLIGGIGPAATEFYYRGLVAAHASTGQALDLTIVHADIREFIRNATAGAAQDQAGIYLQFVKRLQSAGADAVAITSLGGHFCIQELEAISPLPVINAIPIINLYLKQREMKRVALLGTRFVMESGIYGGISAVEFIIPEGDDFDAVHDTYLDIATTGVVTEQQRAFFFSICTRLCSDRGAEAVMLGGTDLYLVFKDHECGFPVIDCAEIHIEALARAASESPEQFMNPRDNIDYGSGRIF